MFIKKVLKDITKFSLVFSLSLSSVSCDTLDEVQLSPDDFSNTQNSKINSVIDGQVVVRFKEPMPTEELANFGQQMNSTMIKTAARLNSAVYKVSQETDIESLIQSLRENPAVQFAERNYILSSNYTVSDPKSREQQGLAMANLAKAWDITFGDPKVIIAVVDTGIDLTHPDLKNKIVPGYNIISQGKTPPKDDNGHGTHASGIAAADTNNKIGVAGTAPRCKLMPIKALDAKGSGDTVNVALGIVWAVDHGARVLNLSLGGPNNETVKKAVEYALAKNVVVVAAMGNDGKNQRAYPAAIPGVISVGSVDSDQSRSSFSNYGSWISVASPGSSILSTMPTYETTMTESEKNKGYDYLDGTSMACPIVAGIAALVVSRNPTYTPAEVKARIESTATDLGKPGYDVEFGHGLVNAFKAVL